MLWNYISFVAGAFLGVSCLSVMLMMKLSNEKKTSTQQVEPAPISEPNNAMA